MSENAIQTIEKKVGVFVTAHHISLYVLLAAALGFGIYSVESKIASVAESKAEAAAMALVVEKDHSAQLQAAYTTAEAQRKQDRDAYLASIQQIQSQAKVQIIHDQQLPAPDLGHRIETLTGFKQGTVTLNSNDDLIVPLPLGREIVTKLDQGEADAQIVVKQDAIIKSQIETIGQQTGIIAEDKAVLAKQIDADGKELKAVKDEAKKSKFKIFGAGVVVGFIGRQFVHFGL
jgi:hypothetical protein